ncbi:eukaryotic translation initiation factor 3 subunit 7-domain-containing protein [Phakopsora pachyrhizi]|nr:eukaryotic translation initiation factor 3 subunit 7-domain-containing protein [Phakopsora pachyrhizi]
MESDKPDSLNTPSALSLEATFINQNFGLQVVKEDPDNDYQFDNPNPFYGPDKTEQCASAGLRQCHAQGGGAPNWRAKLNSQCGAVVATEMKNNSCKLAKWAVQSILAGADQIKMG